MGSSGKSATDQRPPPPAGSPDAAVAAGASKTAQGVPISQEGLTPFNPQFVNFLSNKVATGIDPKMDAAMKAMYAPASGAAPGAAGASAGMPPGPGQDSGKLPAALASAPPAVQQEYLDAKRRGDDAAANRILLSATMATATNTRGGGYDHSMGGEAGYNPGAA